MLQTRALMVWIQAAVTGFVWAAVSKKFPRDGVNDGPSTRSLTGQPGVDRFDEFAHLRDDERGRIGFAVGYRPVGPLERRLETHCLGTSRGERRRVELSVPEQARSLGLSPDELHGTREA